MHANKILLKRENVNYKAGFCILNEELPELEKRIALLHPEEKTYYDTLKFERRKKSYLLGRIAAKQSVMQLLENNETIDSFSLEFGIFHFPVVKYLKHQNIQVTITHCDTIGIALAHPEEHPLGIDIEKIDNDKVATMETIMVDGEYDLIRSCNVGVLEGSALVWTIKEAFSKVLKTGLTVDFKILEIISLEKERELYTSTFKYFSQYKVISKRIGNHICSIVLPKKTSCNLSVFWDTLTGSQI